MLDVCLSGSAPFVCLAYYSSHSALYLVNNLLGHSELTEVWKYCTRFLWYFLQILMSTTENMYRHSVLPPCLIFCTFSVPGTEIFSSDAGIPTN